MVSDQRSCRAAIRLNSSEMSATANDLFLPNPTFEYLGEQGNKSGDKSQIIMNHYIFVNVTV